MVAGVLHFKRIPVSCSFEHKLRYNEGADFILPLLCLILLVYYSIGNRLPHRGPYIIWSHLPLFFFLILSHSVHTSPGSSPFTLGFLGS